jgi:phospholipid N-methyltransferase
VGGRPLCCADGCGLAHGAAAIGAGTGTATRRLLDLGANPLVAIEPDARFATFLRETIEDRALIEHRAKAWQLVLDPDQTVALYATYSNINIRRDCERSSLSWVASLATSATVA